MNYKIKQGDTLADIAKLHNTTVQTLADINNIKNPDIINAGANLYIPDPGVGTVSVKGGSVLIGGDNTQTDKAEKALDKWRESRPAPFEDRYTSKLDSLISSLGKREFSYDMEKDPAYIQYRNKYLNDARRAMEDAMGLAAAKTGGYGNSYAEAAGGAAYGKYLSDFGEIIPELYRAAYDRYSDDGDELLSEIKLLSSLSDSEWDRYGDTLKAYLDEGKQLGDFYSKLSQNDIKNYMDYAGFLKKYSKYF